MPKLTWLQEGEGDLDSLPYSTADLVRPEYSTDTFRMYCFKVGTAHLLVGGQYQQLLAGNGHSAMAAGMQMWLRNCRRRLAVVVVVAA